MLRRTNVLCKTIRPNLFLKQGRKAFSSKVEVFDGEIATLYESIFVAHYHENGPWYKMLHATEQVLRGNEKPFIVDVATGPGEPGAMLAKRFAKGNILLTDVSPDMVEKAKQKISSFSNAKVEVMDAQNMSEIESNSVDVVTCSYGFMFVPEPEKAFSEVQRILKPNGHLIATVWSSLSIMDLNRIIMTEILGEEPPPPSFNPLSMSEHGLVEGLITDAGLIMLESSTHEYPFICGGNPGDKGDLPFKAMTLPIRPALQKMSDDLKFNAFKVAENVFNREIAKGTHAMLSNGVFTTKPNEFKMVTAQKC